MSNNHAKISYRPGHDEGFFLVDVGSTNRTWLRLSPEGDQSGWHGLTVGDILKIGSTVFLVQPNDMNGLGNLPVVNKITDQRNNLNCSSEEEKNNMQIDRKLDGQEFDEDENGTAPG
jgi:predicted component of type VI protein secretion system